MSIKVPVYDRQVNRVTPNMPEGVTLRPPAGAFGTDVAEATTRLGETGLKIADAIMQRGVERQKEIAAKQIADQDTSFRTEIQNVLYNTENDENGKPVGILARKLDQSQGSTLEFDQKYPEIKARYLNSVPSQFQKDTLSKLLDATYTSNRDAIIRHERTQTDESIRNSLESNIDIQANDAAKLQDGASVVRAIQQAEGVQAALNKVNGYDSKTAETKLIEVRGKIAKSAFATAIDEKNLPKAQSIYDSIRGRVSSETELKMKEEIESGIPYKIAIQDAFLDPIGTRIKLKENLYNIKDPVKRKAAFDFTNTLADKVINEQQETKFNGLLDNLSQGKLTLTDVENEMQVPEDRGGIKKTILVKYQNALQSGISKDLNRMLKEETPDNEPTARAKKVKQYTELIDNFISDDVDKWHAREKLAEAYSDGIVNSQEAVFLNKLKSGLNDIEWNRSTGPVRNKIKAVLGWLKGNNASDEEITLNLKKLMGTLQTGEGDPQEISKSLMQNHVYSKIPEAPTFSPNGQLVADSDGILKIVFPDGRVEALPANKEKSPGAKYMESTEKK